MCVSSSSSKSVISCTHDSTSSSSSSSCGDTESCGARAGAGRRGRKVKRGTTRPPHTMRVQGASSLPTTQISASKALINTDAHAAMPAGPQWATPTSIWHHLDAVPGRELRQRHRESGESATKLNDRPAVASRGRLKAKEGAGRPREASRGSLSRESHSAERRSPNAGSPPAQWSPRGHQATLQPRGECPQARCGSWNRSSGRMRGRQNGDRASCWVCDQEQINLKVCCRGPRQKLLGL